jgi:hypothetical protein
MTPVEMIFVLAALVAIFDVALRWAGALRRRKAVRAQNPRSVPSLISSGLTPPFSAMQTPLSRRALRFCYDFPRG